MLPFVFSPHKFIFTLKLSAAKKPCALCRWKKAVTAVVTLALDSSQTNIFQFYFRSVYVSEQWDEIFNRIVKLLKKYFLVNG